MSKYRIHWRARQTGATGHGTGLFPKRQAESLADSLNQQNGTLLYHWVEIAPDEEQPEQPDRTPGLGAFDRDWSGVNIERKGRKR